MSGDEDILPIVMIIVGILCLPAFFLGRSMGDDYWHQECKNYSLAAYDSKEVPARCVEPKESE